MTALAYILFTHYNSPFTVTAIIKIHLHVGLKFNKRLNSTYLTHACAYLYYALKVCTLLVKKNFVKVHTFECLLYFK